MEVEPVEVEPITYVMCEETSCVNSHLPIVLQIERDYRNV